MLNVGGAQTVRLGLDGSSRGHWLRLFRHRLCFGRGRVPLASPGYTWRAPELSIRGRGGSLRPGPTMNVACNEGVEHAHVTCRELIRTNDSNHWQSALSEAFPRLAASRPTRGSPCPRWPQV